MTKPSSFFFAHFITTLTLLDEMNTERLVDFAPEWRYTSKEYLEKASKTPIHILLYYYAFMINRF